MISKLVKLFREEYGDLERVDLPLKKPNYDVAIWLDSYDWILWTGIKDNSTDEVFITPEGSEWKLQQIPSP